MTNLEFSSFCKFAQQSSLASSLILKYNKAFGGGGSPMSRTGSSPRTVSYGPTKMPISSSGTTYNRYVSSIQTQESAGKMNVRNKTSGAMGLYQFMPKTLRGLGYKGDFNTFLNNPSLQNKYMDIFTRQNAKSLGINIGNMTSQQAGYLAAAHYGGVGGARKIMKGNRQYGNTNFHGKTPYGYMNDVLKRMYGR